MCDKALTNFLRAIYASLFLIAALGAWYLILGRPAEAAAAPEPAPVAEKKNPLKAMVDRATTAPSEPDPIVPVPLPEPPPTLDPAKAAVTIAAPATPVATMPTVKTPEVSSGEKPDLLLAKRSERRFAKLREWAARLDAKKAKLKTPFQIEAFNEEAAKYHAELAAARLESVRAGK